MFGFFTKKDEEIEEVASNGYYEGEIISGDYAAGDSEYFDMWAHGRGKMTLTLEDGTVQVYEGDWDVGRFHGQGTLTVIADGRASQTTAGVWKNGELMSSDH